MLSITTTRRVFIAPAGTRSLASAAMVAAMIGLGVFGATSEC